LGRELSNDVKEFIAEHIHSVPQLEVLLLLGQNHNELWSADAAGRELNLNPALAKAQLDDLLSNGLLVLADGTGPGLYRYNHSSSHVNKTLKQLGIAYATQRVAVLSLILAKPTDKVRLFTETFRMIRGDE
jgi:hypothetical protein